MGKVTEASGTSGHPGGRVSAPLALDRSPTLRSSAPSTPPTDAPIRWCRRTHCPQSGGTGEHLMAPGASRAPSKLQPWMQRFALHPHRQCPPPTAPLVKLSCSVHACGAAWGARPGARPVQPLAAVRRTRHSERPRGVGGEPSTRPPTPSLAWVLGPHPLPGTRSPEGSGARAFRPAQTKQAELHKN